MMAPNYQRSKSPQTKETSLRRKLHISRFPETDRVTTTDGSSPGNSMSDGESYECYGEAADPDREMQTVEAGQRSPPGPINRHSWTRTSLRRTPPSHQNESLPHRRWGSMRHSGKRQIGSNVLASQLYRSSSFNSSGCGSAGEPADDVYSDVSLEEDVQGLNYKVQMLQQQVTTLADTQSTADDRYARAKADNAVLQAKIHMLDEQIREIEVRCDERIAEEQKRCRETIARIERDREQQMDLLNERLMRAENEASEYKQEAGRLRGVVEGLRMAAENDSKRYRDAQEQINDITQQLQQARESERKFREMNSTSSGLIAELQAEIERLRRESRSITTQQPDLLRLEELHTELSQLRQENKSLSEAHEELQAQILTKGIEEGRSLLDGVNGPLIHVNGIAGSLAEELGEMTNNQLESEQLAAQLDKMQKALKEQQDVNLQLRNYIDGILLSIVENYPQLLEVKYKQNNNISQKSNSNCSSS